MLEARQRMSHEVDMNGSVEDGFWIRRRASPLPVTAQRRVQRAPTGMDNKENAIPPWAVTVRRPSSNRRKSPLPAWYPRTPLRDITFILQALERKRMKASAAGGQHRSDGYEASPAIHILNSPLPQDPVLLDHTPSSEAVASDISETTSSPTVTSVPSLSSTEDPLQPSSKGLIPPEGPSDLSSNKNMDVIKEQPSDQAVATTTLASKNQQTIEYEKKLGRSIDEIEKAVLSKLKTPQNVPKKTTTRVLMSMR